MKRLAVFLSVVLCAGLLFGVGYTPTIVTRRGIGPPQKPTIIRYKNALTITPNQNLLAEYNWLVGSDRDAQMGPLSATNERTLILSPGLYTIAEAETIDMVSHTNIVGIPGAIIQMPASFDGEDSDNAVIRVDSPSMVTATWTDGTNRLTSPGDEFDGLAVGDYIYQSSASKNVRKGTYRVIAVDTTNNHITIDDVGYGSDDTGCVVVLGQENIGIYNLGFDGNKANQDTNSKMFLSDGGHDIVIRGCVVRDLYASAFDCVGGSNILIEDCQFYDGTSGGGACIVLNSVAWCSVSGIIADTCDYGVLLYATHDCVVDSSLFRDMYDDPLATLQHGGTINYDVTVQNCQMEGGADKAGHFDSVDGLSLFNCKSLRNANQGMMLESSETYTKNVAITHCEFSDNGDAGFYADDVENLTMTNCAMSRNTLYGIYILDGTGPYNSLYTKITGCLVDNNGDGSATIPGIYLNNATYVQILNSRISNNQSSANNGQGIGIDATSHLLISGCEILDNYSNGSDLT